MNVQTTERHQLTLTEVEFGQFSRLRYNNRHAGWQQKKVRYSKERKAQVL